MERKSKKGKNYKIKDSGKGEKKKTYVETNNNERKWREITNDTGNRKEQKSNKNEKTVITSNQREKRDKKRQPDKGRKKIYIYI